MRHHQQPCAACREVLLQPFGHVGVEVVRRLVENQQIRFADQHVGQRHTLELSAREGFDALPEIADFQPREDALRPLFVIPCFEGVHARHRLLQTLARGIFEGSFVRRNGFQRRVFRVEAGFEHGHSRRIGGALLEVGHAQVAARHDAARIVVFTPRDDVQQRGFPRAVFCDEGHAAPVLDCERYIFEEHLLAERFGEVLHLKTTSHSVCFCAYKATQKSRTDNLRPEMKRRTTTYDCRAPLFGGDAVSGSYVFPVRRPLPFFRSAGCLSGGCGVPPPARAYCAGMSSPAGVQFPAFRSSRSVFLSAGLSCPLPERYQFLRKSRVTGNSVIRSVVQP